MTKNSTLIYFIKNFQADLDNYENGFSGNTIQSELTGINTISKGPSERTIENILNFARIYEVVNTRNAGCTELILN
jgi:hypothetical protein